MKVLFLAVAIIVAASTAHANSHKPTHHVIEQGRFTGTPEKLHEFIRRCPQKAEIVSVRGASMICGDLFNEQLYIYDLKTGKRIPPFTLKEEDSGFWEREFLEGGVVRYVFKTPEVTCTTGGGEEDLNYQVDTGKRFYFGRPENQDENDPPLDPKNSDKGNRFGWGYTKGWYQAFAQHCAPKLATHPYCRWLQSLHGWKATCHPDTQ